MHIILLPPSYRDVIYAVYGNSLDAPNRQLLAYSRQSYHEHGLYTSHHTTYLNREIEHIATII